MTTTSVKRSRSTTEQLNCMADFLLETLGLAGSRFQKLHGKFECDKKWKELAAILNSLGGAVKTVDQWHTVWRDLKSRTSIKARDRRRKLALTGNRPVEETLSDFDKRVLGLIGTVYAEGHEVDENIPMEEEFQLRLQEGDESLLFEIPQSSSIVAESIDLRSSALNTPARTPRRSLKRKRAEEDSDARSRFLEIAEKQADALKMLAESNKQSVEVAKQQAETLKILAESSAARVAVEKNMAEAITTLGEGLKATADAFNDLTNAIYRAN